MLVKLSKQTWANIMNEVFYANGLLDYGYIKPKEVAEYLSEQPIELDFNNLVHVKDFTIDNKKV